MTYWDRSITQNNRAATPTFGSRLAFRKALTQRQDFKTSLGGTSISEFRLVFRGEGDESEARTAELRLPVEHWDSPGFPFFEFDGQVDALAEHGAFVLVLEGDPERLPHAAEEVRTRCQRLAPRRSAASRIPLFDRVLAAHRELHDLTKPLVRADYNHALDTWQWMLRLDPNAGLAVQIAALFHDVERLVSEADARTEHDAADYQDFKDAHACRGAEMAAELLASLGVDPATRERTAYLIGHHEGTTGDPDAEDIALLNDADALSFFSLNSPGYLDYFGPEQTRRKVAWTLARMRPEARALLAEVRLLPEVAA
jgi:hypothetical protein